MACYSRAALVCCMIISILLIDNVKCNRQKRATGAVPHSLHAQISRADTVGNNTQQMISVLQMHTGQLNAQISRADMLGNNTQQIVTMLQFHTGQFKNLTDEVKSMSAMMSASFAKLSQSFAILTKGLHLTAGDCSDVAAQGPYASGIYTITPWDDLGTRGSFKVFCDMNPDDAGWTVFQRRINGSVDFYRDWVNYKNGFGDLAGEFWLGLDKLNRLTSTRGVSWQLKVELEDFEGNTAYAVYENFSIGDESTQFQLSIGAYSGTAGDSLRRHEGMKFTTKDRDNDPSSVNLAITYGGGWWFFSSIFCDLNGPYLTSASSTVKSINWYTWKTGFIALKKAQMKMRPSIA